MEQGQEKDQEQQQQQQQQQLGQKSMEGEELRLRNMIRFKNMDRGIPCQPCDYQMLAKKVDINAYDHDNFRKYPSEVGTSVSL